MLGPIVGSWRLLLSGFLGGACLSSVILISRNVTLDGVRTYVGLVTHGKDVGMMCACFAQAFGALLSLGPALWPRRTLLRLSMFGLVVLGMVLCGQRTALLAVAAGLMGYLIMLISSKAIPLDQRRRHFGQVGLGIAALAVLLSMNPRAREWAGRWFSQSGQQSGLLADEGLADDRGPLLRAALIIWSDHLVFGAGAGSFQSELKAICIRSPERIGLSPERAMSFSKLTTCHNGLGDELACRGILGGLIYIMLMASIVWAAVRRPGGVALGVAISIWLAFSLTDAVTLRGTHLAILGVMVAAAASLPKEERSEFSGGHASLGPPQ